MRTNLINARKNKGMTQKQVADYLQMTKNAYCKIEYGERNSSAERWASLEILFSTPFNQLIKNEERKTK